MQPAKSVVEGGAYRFVNWTQKCHHEGVRRRAILDIHSWPEALEQTKGYK